VKWIGQGLLIGLVVFLARFGMEMLKKNGVEDDAPISGGTRTAFLESSLEACLKNDDLKGQPAVAIQQYCTCYTHNLVDRITNERLAGWKNSDQNAVKASMEPDMEKAAEPCVVFFKTGQSK
jgi:hypothetical protein